MKRGRPPNPKVSNEEVCEVVLLFKTRVFNNGKIVSPTNHVFIEISSSLKEWMTPKAIYLFICNNKCAQLMYNEWGLRDVLEEENQQMKGSDENSEASSEKETVGESSSDRRPSMEPLGNSKVKTEIDLSPSPIKEEPNVDNNVEENMEVLTDLQQRAWNGSSRPEQSIGNHSRYDPEEDHWRSHSPSVNNHQESRSYGDESTFCLNSSSPSQDVPAEFEKVFVKVEDVHASDANLVQQKFWIEQPSVGQEPQPGCCSSSDERNLQRGRDLGSTTVNHKGGSHLYKAELKRERGRNFTEMEKSQLVEIVLKYKEITENKRNDKVSLHSKHKIWTQITEEYNSIQITGKRETKTLKSLYEALKAKARKEKTRKRVETLKTGGGPCSSQMSQISLKITSELGGQFEPLENEFDSSSVIYEQVPEESDPVVIEASADPVAMEVPAMEELIIDNSTEGPTIEEPLPTNERPLVPSKKRRMSSEPNKAFEDYSKGKIDVSKRKLELILIEHDKKMKILNLEEETAKVKLEKERVEMEKERVELEKAKVELEIAKLRLNKEKTALKEKTLLQSSIKY